MGSGVLGVAAETLKSAPPIELPLQGANFLSAASSKLSYNAASSAICNFKRVPKENSVVAEGVKHLLFDSLTLRLNTKNRSSRGMLLAAELGLRRWVGVRSCDWVGDRREQGIDLARPRVDPGAEGGRSPPTLVLEGHGGLNSGNSDAGNSKQRSGVSKKSTGIVVGRVVDCRLPIQSNAIGVKW